MHVTDAFSRDAAVLDSCSLTSGGKKRESPADEGTYGHPATPALGCLHLRLGESVKSLPRPLVIGAAASSPPELFLSAS